MAQWNAILCHAEDCIQAPELQTVGQTMQIPIWSAEYWMLTDMVVWDLAYVPNLVVGGCVEPNEEERKVWIVMQGASCLVGTDANIGGVSQK